MILLISAPGWRPPGSPDPARSSQRPIPTDKTFRGDKEFPQRALSTSATGGFGEREPPEGAPNPERLERHIGPPLRFGGLYPGINPYGRIQDHRKAESQVSPPRVRM